MTRKESVLDDPVVREVREARAKLWKEGGGTIQGFRRVVKKRLEAMAGRRRKKAKVKG